MSHAKQERHPNQAWSQFEGHASKSQSGSALEDCNSKDDSVLWEAHGEYDDREQACPHISHYSCFQPERWELKPDWSDSTSGKKSTSVCPWAAGREKSLDVWVGTHCVHTIQCCERFLSVALIVLSPVMVWQLTMLSRISLKHFWNKVFISQYLTPRNNIRLYNSSDSFALKHVSRLLPYSWEHRWNQCTSCQDPEKTMQRFERLWDKSLQLF